jgi:nucleotide-binding universal stress UspA family protein
VIDMLNHGNRSGILVGVDGSTFSDAAVRWAALDAGNHNEELTLMAVLQRDDPSVRNEHYVRRLHNLRRLHATTMLARAELIAETTLGTRRLPPIRTEFVFASPVPALVAESKKARMVVVGCRGKGVLNRLTLGSVSTGLIHHAHCPVAVIHDEAPTPAPHARVLLGIDGSPASELATAIAFDEASHRRAPLTALHAWADATPVGHLNWTIDEDLGREALSERLAGWRERYPDVSVTPKLINHDADRWLVNHSDGAQLVVVGSHGRGGFAGMLLGSVSNTVAHAARVPVIVARRQS